MRDDLKLMLPQGCRLAIKHMAIRIYHRCHIESLFHAAFDFYRRNARCSKIVKMRKHVQILGIQQIRAAIALFYAEALVRARKLLQLIFPTTRLNTLPLVGMTAGKVIADKATTRNSHAHGTVHKHLYLHIGGNSFTHSGDFRH